MGRVTHEMCMVAIRSEASITMICDACLPLSKLGLTFNANQGM